MTKKLYILIGTRPNFIKVTRFKELSSKYNFDVKIIHTGQHFDDNMANVFFDQFDLRPDYFLNVGGLSPNSQVGQIILKLEELFEEIGKPDFFMVPGDVNSTLAGAVAANKLNITLIHLESGLRSFDKKMPEEHNRIVADNLANICMVTEPSGLENIKDENIQAKTYHVGNTMIDTLVKFESKIEESPILEELALIDKKYLLCTFHRPSNVDAESQLKKLTSLLMALTRKGKVVIPLHPRTRKMLMEFDMLSELEENTDVILSNPIGYFEFQKLIKYSQVVITDSGGIQEETTYRKVPCLTVRENTERPVTITQGTNSLVKFEESEILRFVEKVELGNYKSGEVPKFWDGQTTERIYEVLCEQ
ncbi:non-hydrolyzing UDP-N-acetylglucosamine 2-epimerase [Parvicella tangerina]|uniref:UDP-2,3-diacetamido-2,3-dideoxy-D-glucuronate 2-epimerase n=1 Tax=Parvicella tangerina TaxID=2829795 RepID=A0A916JL25_9FLAO|nr:UDP-N-acetylglucosamine 2-epimerase (non-hydrolyzing) [Parvicella tangerina]CAG5079761.1 UDP-2,3-diacetamido-2,3-dideoxy-D-glucuronate 2-epimerase [Parvicella tangerina]